MYYPKTQHVWVSHDVVWLHWMSYQKTANAQEMNMDPITVGNWTRNSQGVLRFIEVGEGVSKDPEKAEIAEDHDNSFIENELEEQPTDNQETQTDNPNVTEARSAPSTPTVVTTSCRVSQPPVQLIEEMGEAAHTAAERNYYFALSELKEERKYGCVGAGIGSCINSTHELKVLRFDEVMATEDCHEWSSENMSA